MGSRSHPPLIGWALGSQLTSLIEPVDHWIAFILLVFIGGKMLWDAFRGDDGCETCGCAEEKLDMRELLMMAVATSIDALAVGVTFAFLGVNVMAAVVVIGVTTFALSFVGVVVGEPVRRTLREAGYRSGRRGARAHRTEDSARAPGRYRFNLRRSSRFDGSKNGEGTIFRSSSMLAGRLPAMRHSFDEGVGASLLLHRVAAEHLHFTQLESQAVERSCTARSFVEPSNSTKNM